MSTTQEGPCIKGAFGLWVSSVRHVTAAHGGFEKSTNDFMASVSSISDLPTSPASERERLRTHFRRSGSRLLSLFSFRSSSPRGETTEFNELLRMNTAADCSLAEQTSSSSRSKPGPKFARSLSTKLSRTFGRSTVVHHGRFHVQHGVIAPEFYTASGDQRDRAEDSSSPSTPLSGSVSPMDWAKSTPPTSEEPSPDRTKTLESAYSEKQHGRDYQQDLAPVRETAYLPATIWTVERTTNAKVYIETRYDSLALDISGRKARAREFSSYLRTLALPIGERVKAQEDFYRQESRYLRQCRVLRSPTPLCSRRYDIVAHAGYVASKVVGHGSFGVVRLVRRKRDDGTLPYDASFEMTSSASAYIHTQRKCMAGKKKEVFAMKVINKTEMLHHTQEGHVRAERDILVQSAKPRWFVPLVTSFQDTENLYLVMDYMVGGDFLGLLVRKDVLSEQWSKFYLAEMVLCVEEAHRLGWIHRDLKPDNFLISASGHLRLSDFGLAFNGHWAHNMFYYTCHRRSLMERLGIQADGDAADQELAAKKASLRVSPGQKIDRPPPWKRKGLDPLREKLERRQYANTYVGTAQYMAPEVVKGEPYDGRCDWWCLGIILYECLFGTTPFARKDREQMKVAIANHFNYLHFPCRRGHLSGISIQAIDLISRLLADKEYRLGSFRYRAVDLWTSCARERYTSNQASRAPPFVYGNDSDEIKNHPFFSDICWDELHKLRPPFVPKVRGWGDTRYFGESTGCLLEDGVSGEGQNENDPSCPSDMEEPPEIKIPKGKARDTVLRDKNLGMTAMNIRKEGAFSGYSYVRPKPVALAFESERVRSLVPKDHLADLYAC